VFVSVTHLLEQEPVIEAVDHLHGPEGAEFLWCRWCAAEHLQQRLRGAVHVHTGGVAFLKQASGMANEPVVFVELQIDEF